MDPLFILGWLQLHEEEPLLAVELLDLLFFDLEDILANEVAVSQLFLIWSVKLECFMVFAGGEEEQEGEKQRVDLHDTLNRLLIQSFEFSNYNESLSSMQKSNRNGASPPFNYTFLLSIS